MALVEYDLGPQELALEVAAGSVDLGAEAELLADPDRRTIAEVELDRLVRGAFDRIDANRERAARAARPAGRRAAALARHDARGAGGGRCPRRSERRGRRGGRPPAGPGIPVGRELADRLADAGLEVEGWRPRPRSRSLAGEPDAGEEAPTGSQRALAVLRRAVDETASRPSVLRAPGDRGAPLAATKQAVVAAFERIDTVIADPMAEE